MNCWPPKPGFTDMRSTRSSLSSVWSSQASGVAGIEHQPGLAAVLADERERAVDVVGRLGMEADDVGARLGEVRHEAVDRLHHQVHVERHARRAAGAPRTPAGRRSGSARSGCPSRRSGSGRRRRASTGAHFLAQPREVGGQDAGGDAVTSWPRGVYNAARWRRREAIRTSRSRAATQYLAEQSDEAAGRYVFAYTITHRATPAASRRSSSAATGSSPTRRAWCRRCAASGVVGAQPLLKPGESFEYTSGTAIATPVGTMRGTYQMVAEDGTRFDAPIPEFTLSVPRVLH